MKKIKICILMLVAFIVPSVAYASDNDISELTTKEDVIRCLESDGICKLGIDIELDSEFVVKNNVILDLNGKTITPAEGFKKKGGFIFVERGGKLTIRDSNGSGKISTGSKDDSDVWGGIQLIYNSDDSSKDSEEVAELVVESGTIEGYYYGITGNGTNHNIKVTINGGTIAGLNAKDSVGIYHPQMGTLTVNGGTIKGGTGIEMRSGDLTVNNGTIEGIAPFVIVVNGNGSTTNGVGVAVAQHKTKNAINVNIKDGNISGEYAFYEWNPHSNNSDALEKISINISGGNFTGTAKGVDTIHSDDFKKFISGGKFNKTVPSEYLTEDAKVASKLVDTDKNIALEKKSSKIGIITLVISLIAIGIGAGYTYFKKFRTKLV